MRRAATAALLALAAAGTVVVASSADAQPEPAVSAPAAEQGPPRIHRAAPESAYLPRTEAGQLAPGDPHEQRWSLATPGNGGSWTWHRIGSTQTDASDGLFINPAIAAPAGAVWFWRAPLMVFRGYRACVRLWDASSQTEVAGSTQCLQVPADWPTAEQTWIYDSRPLTLHAGEHVYILQGETISAPVPSPAVPLGTPVLRRGAELIARWVEPAATTSGR